MLTRGLFTAHQHTFKLRSVKDPIHILPIGDVHYGSELHGARAFKKYLEWGKDRPNCYYLGMGDVIEFCSTSERQSLKAIKLHENTDRLIVDALRAKVAEFIGEYPWLKGRCIGWLEGNHYVQWPNNTTSDDTISDAFGCPNLGVMSLLHLVFDYCGSRATYDMCLHHGKGAARLLGSSLNTVQYMAENMNADLYMMGHDHKQGAITGVRGEFINDRVVGPSVQWRTMKFCRSGNWLESMRSGKTSYSVDAARGALPLGGIRIDFNVWREESKGTKRMGVEAQVMV